MEVLAFNCPEEEWTKPQLKAMCLYKKARGDKGLPDSLPLLQQFWRERRGRLSPPFSPANSDANLVKTSRQRYHHQGNNTGASNQHHFELTGR